MAIIVKEATTRRDINKFIKFYIDLYRDNKQIAFPMNADERKTLNPAKNPSHEGCMTRYILAFDGKKVVGRIAAIISQKEHEKTGIKYGRIGWFDFVDSAEVSEALIEDATKWFKKNGIEKIHGPLGFSDLDREGALIEGFEEKTTMATSYNYPYYHTHFTNLGFEKSVDWLEFEIQIGQTKTETFEQLADRALKMTKCKVIKPKSRKELISYAPEIFRLLDECYADLYGTVKLSDEQVKYFTKAYMGFLNLDLVSLVSDEHDKLIAFGITMPSFTEALQKTKGRLLPFGFIHMLKALKKNDTLDLYLVAIDEKYQGKGVNAIMMNDILKGAKKLGITKAETNLELEYNNKVQNMWKMLPHRQHKRRRCYIKELS